jgi:hypothetical protein
MHHDTVILLKPMVSSSASTEIGACLIIEFADLRVDVAIAAVGAKGNLKLSGHCSKCFLHIVSTLCINGFLLRYITFLYIWSICLVGIPIGTRNRREKHMFVLNRKGRQVGMQELGIELI